MAEGSAYLANKSIFANMDCSQACFVMQMTDELSIELLAYEFGGSTFAFRRLEQGLSRSPTSFSTSVNKHLHAFVESDR